MKQTKQYGLNQWELSDTIRMADFNADNARLEEILAGKTGRFQQIMELSNACQGYTSCGLSFGVEDWSDWECVLATLDLQGMSFPEGYSFILRIMDTDIKVDETKFRGLAAGSFCLLLFPLHDKTSMIWGFAAGSGAAPIFPRRPFEELKGLSVFVRTEADATSKVLFNDAIWRVYGMK